MRLNQVLVSALYSSAALLGQAQANEVEFDEVEDATPASVAESATSSTIEKPTFTVGDPPSQHPLVVELISGYIR